MAVSRGTRVAVEVGARRTFASALDWPGWCRSGRGEEGALEALATYAPRYAPVASLARLRLPADAATTFAVVERLTGNATTDFGAPGMPGACDTDPVDADEARRLASLVEAAWNTLDRVAAGAPAYLRKGPRGGGRDRDAVVAHVVEAERAYARKLGLRLRPYDAGDAQARAQAREALLDLLRTPSEGQPLAEKGWPLRYGVRRIAWHVLDHAWEIEDRSTPA